MVLDTTEHLAANPATFTTPPISPPPAAHGGPQVRWSVTGAEAAGPRANADVSAARLNADELLAPAPPRPAHGWRRAVARLTRGSVIPAPSRAEQHARAVVARVQQPLARPRTVALLSTKGGVGKTTTSLGVASTFAAYRSDRVVALDGNPDAGTLGHRVPRGTDATALDLLDAAETISGYTQLRPYVHTTPWRLEVVGAPDNPHAARALGRSEYQTLIGLLARHYSVVVVDCGTGILDAATRGIVEAADQLVVVAGATVDSTRAVAYLLGWLDNHGFGQLVRDAVAVVNNVPADPGPVDVAAIEQRFAPFVRATVRVPADPHLATGALVDLGQLRAATRDAWLRLAALVADGFPDPTTDDRLLEVL